MDASLIKELIDEEGLRLYVYDDATGEAIVPGSRVIGHPSIGVGRSLDTYGITSVEATFLLDNNLAEINKALSAYPWWIELNPVRQFIICDMAFNMGIKGMLGFPHMVAALFHKDYDRAATEMLASNWSAQLPTRSHRLAQAMRLGHFPEAVGSAPANSGALPIV